jgi:exopolysaccharide biosynthesis polyprenyl glycosylphosphotransferase
MQPAADRPSGTPERRILVLSDAATIFLSWLVVSVASSSTALARPDLKVLRLIGVVAVGLSLMALDRLYRVGPANVRSIELVRLSRVAIGTAIAAYVFGLAPRGQRQEVVIGAVCCFVALNVTRRLYTTWLRAAWKRGKRLRPVVVIGNDTEAARVATLMDHHPEFGFRVCGLAADNAPRRARPGRSIPLLGSPNQALRIVQETGASFAVITPGGLSPVLRKQLLRDLTLAGIHVQVSPGLPGISHRRLRALPLGHEPFVYVEPLSLGRPQMMAKRAMDLVVAPLVLLVALPVLLLAAICIKIEDRGPIFFRQERVGRDGRRIMVYKLRTMVVDAESRLEQILAQNERTGPLFKLARDPRTTRVGRILRASSIDELPQLFNVLNGTMTLVGPRPALPREVDQFDDELLGRLRVTPGVTGLWQVEARDDPSFESYRLLDMLYVDNWSLSLDLAIMAGTVVALLTRVVRLVHRSTKADDRLDVNECEQLGCHRVADLVELRDVEEGSLGSRVAGELDDHLVPNAASVASWQGAVG